MSSCNSSGISAGTDAMIQFPLWVNGEKLLVEIPPETRAKDLVNFCKVLNGADVSSLRVNGRPAAPDQVIRPGDRGSTAPTSGRLGIYA